MAEVVVTPPTTEDGDENDADDVVLVDDAQTSNLKSVRVWKVMSTGATTFESQQHQLRSCLEGVECRSPSFRRATQKRRSSMSNRITEGPKYWGAGWRWET